MIDSQLLLRYWRCIQCGEITKVFGNFSYGVYDMPIPRPYRNICCRCNCMPISGIPDANIDIDNVIFALHTKSRIENALIRANKLPGRRKDYPSCVAVSIYDNNHTKVAFERSGSIKDYTFHNIVRTEFIRTLGVEDGKYSTKTKCRWKVGNCAEQRAVNDIIQCNDVLGTVDLIFKSASVSVAVRPRTMVFIPKCENCNNVFS